jgi:hypothetical protein
MMFGRGVYRDENNNLMFEGKSFETILKSKKEDSSSNSGKASTPVDDSTKSEPDSSSSLKNSQVTN